MKDVSHFIELFTLPEAAETCIGDSNSLYERTKAKGLGTSQDKFPTLHSSGYFSNHRMYPLNSYQPHRVHHRTQSSMGAPGIRIQQLQRGDSILGRSKIIVDERALKPSPKAVQQEDNKSKCSLNEAEKESQSSDQSNAYEKQLLIV